MSDKCPAENRRSGQRLAIDVGDGSAGVIAKVGFVGLQRIRDDRQIGGHRISKSRFVSPKLTIRNRNRRQGGDYRDDYEQLEQRKSPTADIRA